MSGVQKGQPINPKKLARNGPALTPTVESVLERGYTLPKSMAGKELTSDRLQLNPRSKDRDRQIQMQSGIDVMRPVISIQYVIEKQAQGVPLDDLRVVPYADPLTIVGESMAGALVVSVRKPDGTLTTLQFIAPPDVAERLKANDKPEKLNLPECPVQGWFTVGVMVPGSVVYIVEGIGQAWACWQATGAAAVVCFGAGNMRRVAAELRHQDNAARLVVVPDAGKEKQAAEIAAEVQGQFVTIPQGWEQNEDVNDFAQRDGMDALKLLLQRSSEPPKPEPLLKKVSVGDVISNPSEKPAFAWKGYLPRGVVTLMSAHGGSGNILDQAV